MQYVFPYLKDGGNGSGSYFVIFLNRVLNLVIMLRLSVRERLHLAQVSYV